MRLEFSSNDSATSFVEDEYPQNTVLDKSSDDILEMLRDGIKAAQSGNRSDARHLLLRVTEADSKNENAWLWLASISEYPEELLVFLNNVLDINPENERAQEWAKATKSLLAKTFVQRGIDADKENRKDFARQCFMQAVVHDNHNEMAWLWLAWVAEREEEKMAHLRRVLEINPKNETALTSLNAAKEPTAESLLSKANAAAVAGDGESARSLLKQVLKKSPELESAWILKSHLANSFVEKARCFEKILEFNPDSEVAKANLNSLRAMLEKTDSAEEQNQDKNPAISAVQIEDEEDFSNSPTEKLYFSPEDKSEVEIAFEGNGSDSEAVEMMNESSYQETSAEENYWESANPETEVEDDNFEFEAVEESAEEYSYEELQDSYQQNFEENEREEVSAETQSAEDSSFEKSYPGDKEENPDDCYEIDVDEVFAADEITENDFSANFAEPEADSSEENSYQPLINPVACPFCEQENESQAFVCGFCNAMLTFSDLEMLLAHGEANSRIVQKAVEEMEAKEKNHGLEADELVNLGIGHINLKNFRKGLSFLQKAAKLDSNNVVLDSHVNSLTIRLSEIEEKESVHSSMPKDKTIMVVDDSATVRKLISGKLEKCGHIVIPAVDGMDAMEKLNDIVPDLILLDITMPRMDGYQVCKLIRNNESTKEIPIVMISGKDGFFDKVRGRMAGTTSYITKPFGPETLMKMLETYLV